MHLAERRMDGKDEGRALKGVKVYQGKAGIPARNKIL